MNKKVELPIIAPIYNTYNFQGIGGAIISKNPSIRNWYLNQIMILDCSKKFLNGYTSPEIGIISSSWKDNPYVEKKYISMEFLCGRTNSVIKEMIDKGYYVVFDGIDDYYINGKSFYKKRHFSHDGLICGYDTSLKTFSILAYDSNWIFNLFKTSQNSFSRGRKSMAKQNIYGNLCGIKVTDDIVELNPAEIYNKLTAYINPKSITYPPGIGDHVCGTDVHDYIIMYIDKLCNGQISYERIDWRIFRLIWEHKLVMFERIQSVEDKLNMDNKSSQDYMKIVADADSIRMMYALYCTKRHDSVLPIITKKLIQIKESELQIIEKFLKKLGGAL